jgi:hypothetical protein
MRHWTESEKKKQARLIQGWRPWENSSGPKSRIGKDLAKANSYKHGMYCKELRAAAIIVAACARIRRESDKQES